MEALQTANETELAAAPTGYHTRQGVDPKGAHSHGMVADPMAMGMHHQGRQMEKGMHRQEARGEEGMHHRGDRREVGTIAGRGRSTYSEGVAHQEEERTRHTWSVSRSVINALAARTVTYPPCGPPGGEYVGA